jgi:adenylylsulfate kinase
VSWTIWLTGPPASGKSEIARALLERLAARGIPAVWLESDALRRILAPEAGYSPEDRKRFYEALADLAALLSSQGLNVIVDATAPRRAHRDRLRASVPGLVEVLVDAPLEVREARDPKGLYRRAREGKAPHLPGATEAYEEPESPDLVLSGVDPPQDNARRLERRLAEAG